MSPNLQRRYRRLLLAYPARYRRTREAEMLGTLLESSRPDQRWPSIADTVDLIAGGLRYRCGLSTVPRLAAGLALAAPLALAFAAGIGGYYFLAEWAAAGSGLLPESWRGLGPFPTIGPVVYAAWMLAALGRAVLPRLAAQWLAGAAIAATVLVIPAAALGHLTRPTLPLLVPLLLFGLLALAGGDPATSRVVRLAAALGPAVVAGALVALTEWKMAGVVVVDWGGATPADPGALALAYGGGMAITVIGQAVLLLLAGLVIAGAVRRDAAPLWTTALLLVPGLPLVARLGAGLGGMMYSTTALMPAGLLAGIVVLAAAIRLAGSGSSTSQSDSALRLAGVLALGATVAVGGYAWIAGLGEGRALLVWPTAALLAAVLPRRGVMAALGLAVTVTVAVPIPDDLYPPFGAPFGVTQGMLIALGVIALAGVPAEAADPDRILRRLTGIAAAAVLGLGVIAISTWQVDFAVQASHVALAAIAPSVAGLVAGWRAMRGPLGIRWGRGLAMLLASAGWLAWTQPSYTMAWQLLAVLGGLLLTVPAVALMRRSATGSPARPS